MALLKYAYPKGWLLKVGSILLAAGSLSFATGCLFRNLFLNAVGWEPLLPLGFLAFIAGCISAGIALLKGSSTFKIAGTLLMVSGVLLLSYNDQYTPWMAIPFSVCILATIWHLPVCKAVVLYQSKPA
jgi:hypothetical protein